MSTPQFSLIVFEGSSGKPELQEDLKAFFQKFSIPYEVFWLAQGQQKFREFQAAVDKAQSPYIATLKAPLTSPLGDVLKLLQTLTNEDQLSIVFGERLSKKKQNIHPREMLFTRILHEQKKNILKDPFCDFLVFRKSAWGQLSEGISPKARFITRELQKRALTRSLPFAEIYIHETAMIKPRHSLWNFLATSLY